MPADAYSLPTCCCVSDTKLRQTAVQGLQAVLGMLAAQPI
jgi:hypothetical protein